MKTYKLLYSFVLLLIGVAFTACGDDDNDTSETQRQLIIGTWDTEPNEDGDIFEFIFNANGQFVENIYIEGQIDDIMERSYSINEDVINIIISIHKERIGSNKWAEKTINNTQTFRFHIEGKKLKISTLSGDRTMILTRK